MKFAVHALLLSPLLLQDGSAFVSAPSPPNPSLASGTFTFLSAAEEASEETSGNETPARPKPIILDPYLPAADPEYPATGAVGEGSFVVSRTGGPSDEELADENLYRIVEREASDLDVNTLVWKCLGYRFDADDKMWTPAEVFPKWKDRFPDPPDFIGMQRIYSKEIDGPCLRNNQHLVRSIPAENKASYLKKHMLPFGFTGYKVSELTPNLTRRAQCVNWLLFYREELYGYTVEELIERRRRKREQQERERDGSDEEWKPPVKEVF